MPAVVVEESGRAERPRLEGAEGWVVEVAGILVEEGGGEVAEGLSHQDPRLHAETSSTRSPFSPTSLATTSGTGATENLRSRRI